MNRCKSCHLTSVHSAFDVRIFHKQAKSLAKAGYDITLIAPHERDEFVGGVKIIAVPKPKDRVERIFVTLWRVFIKALAERANVYHFHDPELIPAGLLLKVFGARVIYDVHEDYPASIRTKTWLPSLVRRISAGAFNILEKMSHYFFDAVVAATDHISTRFQDSRTVTLHNYPILSHAVGRSGHRLPGECHTVIYAGGLSRARGIREIIQSLEYINKKLQVKLRLLGGFVAPDFEKEIRSMEVFSEVDYVGLVPFEDVNHYLAVADIGLVLFLPAPNHIEAMPNKVFEYMTADLPVIASNFPLWKEIVEGNGCGMCVDPLNPREIAEVIEYLLGKPELMEEMGKNGRRAVLEKYNWERESKRLLKLYHNLTGTRTQ